MEWLNNLAADDEVIIARRYSKVIVKVERTTATQIIVNGQRFDRKTGREKAVAGWSIRDQLFEATPTHRAEIENTAKRTAAIYTIECATSGNRIHVYTTDQLERIAAILDEPRL